MPNYKGHLAGGLAIAAGCAYVVSWWVQPTCIVTAQWFICALFGSLFPDIDTKSQGQLLTYRLLAIVVVILVIQQRFLVALGFSALGMLPLVVHHRGLFHRVWFIGLSCLGIVLYTWMAMPVYVVTVATHTLFFFVGALSHIWLDVGFRRMFRL